MKTKTNFDLYLEEQLKDPAFADRFAKAGEAWDIAVQKRIVIYWPENERHNDRVYK